MNGWILTIVFWVFTFFIWRSNKKNTGIKKFSTNAKWLFGIFVFLIAFDVWITFFMMIWLGIAVEINPLVGTNITLEMIIVAKVGQIFLIFHLLRYISSVLSRKNFDRFFIFFLIVMNLIIFCVIANNEYFFYAAVFNAVNNGFYVW